MGRCGSDVEAPEIWASALSERLKDKGEKQSNEIHFVCSTSIRLLLSRRPWTAHLQLNNPRQLEFARLPFKKKTSPRQSGRTVSQSQELSTCRPDLGFSTQLHVVRFPANACDGAW
jgi:hypothetical protein